MFRVMLAEFRAQPPRLDPDAPDIVAILIVLGCAAVITLCIRAVVCLILYSIQSRVPAQFRKIEPGMVWLMMIPLVDVVWCYFVYLRVPESLKATFNAMGRYDVGDCGRSMGLTIAVLVTVATLGSCIPFVNCLTGVGGLVALVLLIIFLVKLSGLKNQLPLDMPAGMMPMTTMPGSPPTFAAGQQFPPYQPPPPPPQ